MANKMKFVVGETDPDSKDDEEDEEVAYLYLPDHPGQGLGGSVARTTRLLDLVKYEGPDIYLDFDSAGRLIGIEILA